MGARDQENTCYVGNLHHSTKEDDLHKVFEKFGSVNEGLLASLSIVCSINLTAY